MNKLNFGKWLTEELKKRNLRPADLARLSHINDAVISHLINGKRFPGTKTAQAIAKALEISVDEVYQAAGLLQSMSDDPTIKSIVTILNELRHVEVLGVLEYVKLRKRLQSRADDDTPQSSPDKRSRKGTVST